MDKTVQIFKSHAEAEAADRAYYLSLSPQQRMEIMLELNARQPGASARLERVYRVVKLERD